MSDEISGEVTSDPPNVPDKPHETNQDNMLGEIKELVTTILAKLESTVDSTVEGDLDPDDKPTKGKPWTHWGA